MKNVNSNQIFIVLLCIFFCSCDEESNDHGVMDVKNTVWFSEGANCDSFLQFIDDTFVLLNPCYNAQEVIDIVSFQKGDYVVSQDSIILNVQQTCDASLIGFRYSFGYTKTGNSLQLRTTGSSLQYSKVANLPSIPSSAAFGYWDFDNDGSWVEVPACDLD